MTYFDSIIGQDSIKAHLSELVSRNALPHSLLFYGEAEILSGKADRSQMPAHGAPRLKKDF